MKYPKKRYNSSCDNWMITNQRPMTIYDIVSIVREPFTKAFYPPNIQKGFQVAGIEPFNHKYLPSSGTDRAAPVQLPPFLLKTRNLK